MRLTLSGSVSASRRFGCLISPARASSVSRSPYSVMSCAAVLSPMPGAPGTLSVESPASAWTSTTLSGPDAEIFDDFGRAEAPLLARARDPGLAGSRVVHRDAGIDELHEILVGRDDEDVGAGLARLTRVSGDDVVGLVAALLDRDHAERRDGGAHEGKLRHELVGRILPVRLVGRIEVAPERVLRLVEDHREMGRLVARRPVADELQHLGREQPHRAGREAIGPVVVLLVLADRLIIGAEDKRRAVDEKNMVAGADRTVGLGHSHHIRDAGSERHPGEVRPALDGDRGRPSSGRERAASRAASARGAFSNFDKLSLNPSGFTSPARRGRPSAAAALSRFAGVYGETRGAAAVQRHRGVPPL